MASNKWFHAPLWASQRPLGGQWAGSPLTTTVEIWYSRASLESLSLRRNVYSGHGM